MFHDAASFTSLAGFCHHERSEGSAFTDNWQLTTANCFSVILSGAFAGFANAESKDPYRFY
jgi:hypothetical protein